MKAFRVALVAVGAALGVVVYSIQVDNIHSPAVRAAATVVVAWIYLGTGLLAWARRPGNQVGPLITATGFALLIRQFRYSHNSFLFTIGLLLSEVNLALFAHATLAYPVGRVVDRLEKAFLAVAYVAALAFPLGILLFYDGTKPLHYFDKTSRTSLFLIDGNAAVVAGIQRAFAITVYGVLAMLFILLIVRKLVQATPRARAILWPLVLAAAFAAARAISESIFGFSAAPGSASSRLFWWQVAGQVALPIALLAGLLRARLTRVRVGDLVVELEGTPPEGLRDALARALGDPTLEVVFWLPERQDFVNANGESVTLPEDGTRRAVTMLEHNGERYAALVHDPTLRDEPRLVEAAAAAARLALENARLQAEVRAQLAKVSASRTRIVAAADEQRQRIERDLHDGAQQRLVALALELRNAQRRLGVDVDPEVERILVAAVDELQLAVAELRELARGIYPRILTEDGLAAALESLAVRMPVPVKITATEERLAPELEATAYFLACEALTNAVKYANASSVEIRASRDNGSMVIEVVDDGVGGADPAEGSGLTGLAERLEAHGGSLRVESRNGYGTRVVGELPCGS